jgi:alpha-galactosidase
MLPLGRIGIRAEIGENRMSKFTKDEQITLMTLWSVFKSPLMFGGDLPGNDEFTLRLLTNREVLEVNQQSVNNKQLFRNDDTIALVADDPKTGDKFLALFNADDPLIPEITDSIRIRVKMEQLGLAGPCKIRDLWNHQDLGDFQDEFAPFIRNHGAGIYRISPMK